MAAAALLPTEIVQAILSHATSETFHSARQVCQSWRYAAFCGILLQRQLLSMPVRISREEAQKSSAEELNALFDRAAHANLFGMRHHVEKSVADRCLPNQGGTAGVTATSGDGAKLVVLTGGRIDVHEDHGDGDLRIKSHRSLAPLWMSVSRTRSDGITSWMSMAPPYATYQTSLSKNGDLVAVALGRTIQIYDLRPGFEDLQPVECVLNTGRKEVSSDSFEWSEIRGVVEKIQFVEEDSLLRISMGKEGVTSPLTRVLYLGNPPPQWGNGVCSTGEPLSYWRDHLKNTYLDSVELAKTFGGEYKISFRGLQLLPRNQTRGSVQEGGRFFATAVQSSMKNHYCLGFISEQNEVSILCQLPDRSDRVSREWKERLGAPSPQGAGSRLSGLPPRWDLSNIPESKTTHPIIATSENGMLWAVYEPGAGQPRNFASGGAIYICRLQTSAISMAQRSVEDAGIETQRREAVVSVAPQSWPFMLDTVSLDVRDLRIKKESAVSQSLVNRYVVCAETERCTFRWSVS